MLMLYVHLVPRPLTDNDTAAGAAAEEADTAEEGIIITGQGKTNDVMMVKMMLTQMF